MNREHEIAITASCLVVNGSVYKDGIKQFAAEPVDLDKLLPAVYSYFGFRYPKFHKMDNLSKLGWLATEILLQDTDLTAKYPASGVGVVLSNANASLDTDRKYYDTVKDIPSPALFVYTLPNIVTGEICIRHRLKGENAFFVSESFDAPFIHQYVSNMINNDILQCCICGWVDVLGNDYKAALFLVEKGQGAAFTVESINKIYALENG